MIQIHSLINFNIWTVKWIEKVIFTKINPFLIEIAQSHHSILISESKSTRRDEWYDSNHIKVKKILSIFDTNFVAKTKLILE